MRTKADPLPGRPMSVGQLLVEIERFPKPVLALHIACSIEASLSSERVLEHLRRDRVALQEDLIFRRLRRCDHTINRNIGRFDRRARRAMKRAAASSERAITQLKKLRQRQLAKPSPGVQP